MKKYTKPAKKIPGKKPVWRFRPGSVKKSTVLKKINYFGQRWHFSGKNVISQAPTLRVRNYSGLIVLKDDLSQYDMLGALDLFVLHKLFSEKKVNQSEWDKVDKITTLRDPLIRFGDKDQIDNYYYLCLERNKEVHESWLIRVRSRSYILEGDFNKPYRFVGFKKTTS